MRDPNQASKCPSDRWNNAGDANERFQECVRLPDDIDSGSFHPLIASDKWQMETQSRCGYDSVRHVGNRVPGNLLYELCDIGIQRRDPQSHEGVFESRHQPLKRPHREAALFDKIDHLDKGDQGKEEGFTGFQSNFYGVQSPGRKAARL